MSSGLRSAVLIAVVVVAVVVTVVLKLQHQAAEVGANGEAPVAGAALPRLVDLGSTTCIPCLMMKPVMDELRQRYEGQLQVDFIDVFRQRSEAETYQIRSIPTILFFSPEGEELHRHEGFISKEDILATWERLGIPFNGAAAPSE